MEKLLVTNKFFSLPESMNLFSVGHFVQIGLMVAILVASFFVFRGKKNWTTTFFVIMSVLSNLFILAIYLFSLKTGIYNPEWYVPAHICNLFVMVFPLMAINKKIRAFLCDYTFYFGILGCIFAIAMPATTQLYFAPFDYVSIFIFLYHILIGMAGVFVVVSGNFVPKISTFWRLVVVFLPLSVVAIILNSAWDTNFIFLNTSKLYYPLNLFASWFGNYFVYFLASFVMVAPMIMFVISLGVLSAKNILVSKVLSSSRLIGYIKEKQLGKMIKNSEYIQSLLTNQNIVSFAKKLLELLDYQTFKQCYFSVEDDLKALTVGQIEDPSYMMKILKKSKIIGQLLLTMKFKKIKSIMRLMKNAPLAEFISITNQHLELQKKILPQMA